MFCLPWVKCCRLHALCIYEVAITASSDELEASIAWFSAAKQGNVSSSPSPLVNTERWQTSFLFAVGKVLPSHPLSIYRVAISASSDELEASIASFSATKEGDVASSPSPPVNN